MANLNFPDPTVVQTYTAAGITWTWNATKNVWSSELEGGGAGASVSVGDNPPADAEQGDMWWNSSDDSGRLYVYYEDTNSSQWVEASPQANGDDVYLSKVNNDTAAGAITFEGLTTHEEGVNVTGGDAASIENGIAISNSTNGLDLFYDRLALISDNKPVFTIGKDQQAYGLYANSDLQLNQSGTYPALLSLTYNGSGHLSTAEYSGFLSVVTADVGSNVSHFNARHGPTPAQTADNIKLIGFNSNVAIAAATGTNSKAYNFYASGNAPNYFKGVTEHASGIEVTGGEFDSIDTGLLAINGGVELKAGDNVIAAKKDSNLGLVFVSAKVTGTGNVIGSYFAWNNAENHTGSVYGIQSALGTQGFSSSSNVSAFHTSARASNNISCDGVVSGFSCDVRLNGNIGTGSVYSIYAYGTAPSYFAGDIQCDGKVNGSFSLRMQSDDPAAFTTTYSTDEEGNEVTNSVYQGTTEDLLSVIKDLRARIEELESNTLQPLYSTLADLPSAADHHGKTAHVHSEGALYFAHAGNWIKLQNA